MPKIASVKAKAAVAAKAKANHPLNCGIKKPHCFYIDVQRSQTRIKMDPNAVKNAEQARQDKLQC